MTKHQVQEHKLHSELLPEMESVLAESKMSLPSQLIPPEDQEVDVEEDCDHSIIVWILISLFFNIKSIESIS